MQAAIARQTPWLLPPFGIVRVNWLEPPGEDPLASGGHDPHFAIGSGPALALKR